MQLQIELEQESISTSNIPIMNIWLLMAYAANLDTDVSPNKTGTQNFEENLMDTVAELLCDELKKQLKFGLNLGFETHREELPRLRGKVDHINTARAGSYMRGKIICVYEKLNHNTIENQIVRLSLYNVIKYVKNPQIKLSCKSLETHLAALGVDLFHGNFETILSRKSEVRGKSSHLLALAGLALRMDLISEESGNGKFLSPQKREAWI